MVSDLNLFKEKNSLFLKKVKSKLEISKEDTCDGYLIDTNGDEKETRKIIDSLKSKDKIIAVIGNTNQYNRRVIETMKINYLISPEKFEKRDGLKQRDSGLNHVIAKIALSKGIIIVFSLSEMNRLNSKDKAQRLSRFVQNIVICRKAKCNIRIASLAKNESEVTSAKERETLISTLGATSKQTSDSTKF